MPESPNAKDSARTPRPQAPSPERQARGPKPHKADAMPCDRCGAGMFRMHAVWRCPRCGFKTDCCGW